MQLQHLDINLLLYYNQSRQIQSSVKNWSSIATVNSLVTGPYPIPESDDVSESDDDDDSESHNVPEPDDVPKTLVVDKHILFFFLLFFVLAMFFYGPRPGNHAPPIAGTGQQQ